MHVFLLPAKGWEVYKRVCYVMCVMCVCYVTGVGPQFAGGPQNVGF